MLGLKLVSSQKVCGLDLWTESYSFVSLALQVMESWAGIRPACLGSLALIAGINSGVVDWVIVLDVQ